MTRRTRKEVLKDGLGRLQKLLAALPAQQRLKSLQYLSESLRSSLLRHMELQQMQRSTDASMSVRSSRTSVRPAKRKAPCQKKSPMSSSKGISMIKTKDGHRRYVARAIISGIAISSRCVRSLEEAQDLRAHLENQVSRHRVDSTGEWLEVAFGPSQEGHSWHFRATVDARRFLGRTLSSRQVTCIRQALALKQDLESARQQGWPMLRASWVQSMQEQRCSRRFGHRALSASEADAMCRAAEEKAESCPRVQRTRPSFAPCKTLATLRAEHAMLARQNQLQRLVMRLEKTLKAIQMSRKHVML